MSVRPSVRTFEMTVSMSNDPKGVKDKDMSKNTETFMVDIKYLTPPVGRCKEELKK